MIKRFYHVTFRQFILSLYVRYLNFRFGMNISPSARVSLKAKLDKTNPKGVYIGDYSYIAFGAVILSHDMCRSLHAPVKIGRNCFIGAHSIVLPGVSIGSSSIVAAGAVVTKDVPPNSLVAGNPAVIVKSGIETGNLGILVKKH